MFEKASDTHADVVFGKIDTEAEQELAGAAGIQAIPTLMLFRDGVLLFRESGALPPAALEELVTQAKALDMEKVKKEIAEHSRAPARPRLQSRPRATTWSRPRSRPRREGRRRVRPTCMVPAAITTHYER